MVKLTKELVEELASVKADKKKLEEREKELVEDIKKTMKRLRLQEYGPLDCPFKLVFSEFKKASVSWKDQWVKLARIVYGKRKYLKVEKKLLEESKEPSSSLNVEVNENYKGEAE